MSSHVPPPTPTSLNNPATTRSGSKVRFLNLEQIEEQSKDLGKSRLPTIDPVSSMLITSESINYRQNKEGEQGPGQIPTLKANIEKREFPHLINGRVPSYKLKPKKPVTLQRSHSLQEISVTGKGLFTGKKHVQNKLERFATELDMKDSPHDDSLDSREDTGVTMSAIDLFAQRADQLGIHLCGRRAIKHEKVSKSESVRTSVNNENKPSSETINSPHGNEDSFAQSENTNIRGLLYGEEV